ncbi:MAG TPA: septum formation initiator family protein [Piscirickettsiaceae bacterium]|nr:septum formation initiator family protein [Piscirickettsiaceae bacterium]HIQ41101.1 septum formation initiator family protein [Sulfurivirga caldicuralii]
MNPYRIVIAVLVVLIILLQVRIWSTDGGYAALQQLRQQVSELQRQVAHQQRENARLEEKIHAIRHDPQALEALARRDLGMLMPDEQFIRLIVLPKPENSLKNTPQQAEK